MFPIRPKRSLAAFSEFVQEDVVASAEERESELWSMALALDTLGRERRGMHDAVQRQRTELLDVLAELEALIDQRDDVPAAVVESVETGRERIESQSVGTDVYELDEDFREVARAVLASIDEELPPETAASFREPMFRFLSVRVDAHLAAIDHGDGITELTRRAYDG